MGPLLYWFYGILFGGGNVIRARVRARAPLQPDRRNAFRIGWNALHGLSWSWLHLSGSFGTPKLCLCDRDFIARVGHRPPSRNVGWRTGRQLPRACAVVSGIGLLFSLAHASAL